jgi:hypothetical protein
MKLGFANMYVANSNGRGGMLLMFSSQHVRLSLKYLHTNYIDVLVMGDDPSKDWRLTGLYGESVWRHKHRTWSWLHDLHGQANYPWLVIGDMNEILYNTEKEGGQPRPQRYFFKGKALRPGFNLIKPHRHSHDTKSSNTPR